MNSRIHDLPEVYGPFETTIRVPEYASVPLTSRILKIIDARELQRLRLVKQLGFVEKVYPGAGHTRFEHSLGVYHRAINIVKHLCDSESLLDFAGPQDITMLLLACLVHDIGHYFGAHVVEEFGKLGILQERFGQFDHLETGYRLLIDENSEIGAAVEDHFNISRAELADYVFRKRNDGIRAELYKLLDGPIDVDKMDYLERDSIHTGVPYGRNYDIARLTSNFTIVNPDGSPRILLREKGKAGAEVFIFSRYVMFSEVYWHHTARSLSAMLRRAFMDLARDGLNVEEIIGHNIYAKDDWKYYNDDESFGIISDMAANGGSKMAVARELLNSLAAGRSGLYKRLLMIKPDMAEATKKQTGDDWSRRVRERFSSGLKSWFDFSTILVANLRDLSGIGQLREHHVLLDTPLRDDRGTMYPLYFQGDSTIRDIINVSPIAGALDESFNTMARHVRLYCHPDFAGSIKREHAQEALEKSLS
jgi:HD superfamily phosphohydrolase